MVMDWAGKAREGYEELHEQYEGIAENVDSASSFISFCTETVRTVDGIGKFLGGE